MCPNADGRGRARGARSRAGPVLLLGISLPALQHPCYLTTDDEGIGVTTTRGTRALRWEEIQSLERVEDLESLWKFVLTSGEKLNLRLTGYSSELQNALVALVKGKADLVAHPKKNYLYTRASAALPEGGT